MKVMQYIESEMNMSFDYSQILPFTNQKEIDTSNCDKQLLEAVYNVYNELKSRKLAVD
jgi:hypothetical protein